MFGCSATSVLAGFAHEVELLPGANNLAVIVFE